MSRIRDVTSVIALSPKRFIAHFKSDIGLTPKRYCRVRCFQRAVAGADAGRTIDWTELALLCGYFHRAHFIHEFYDFAGMSPTTYEACGPPSRTTSLSYNPASGDVGENGAWLTT
jgi:AraC-like DNA-binding protein